MITAEKLAEANKAICESDPQLGTFTPEEVMEINDFLLETSWDWRGGAFPIEPQSMIVGICIGWVAGIRSSEADVA